jgi:hypothetical protein
MYLTETKLTFIRILKRGLTLNVFSMESFSKHKIEQAKEKLRNKLSFEFVKKLPKYRNITKKQYELLIINVERVCLVLLESYIISNNTNNG